MKTLLFTFQNWILTARYYLSRPEHEHCTACGARLTDPFERNNGICQSCNAW